MTHTKVDLPVIFDMGSAYAGRGCNIVRMILERGGISETDITNGLMLGARRAHQQVAMMVDAGILLEMRVDGVKMLFLSDKKYWLDRMEGRNNEEIWRNIRPGKRCCRMTEWNPGGACGPDPDGSVYSSFLSDMLPSTASMSSRL